MKKLKDIRIKREMLLGMVVLMIAAALVAALNLYRQNKTRSNLAEEIFSLGPGSSGRGGPPETIEGLREAIALYEKRIEQHVKDAAQTAVYWKILATRLQDKGMHNEALEALEQAIAYAPTDQSLFCMTGISAGIAAKSVLDFGSPGTGTVEQARLYALAEDSFLRSIELDDTYARPRYALAVLYAFDLDRPEDAIPQLEAYLKIVPEGTGAVDALFVLARACYQTLDYARAVTAYDRILGLTKDETKRTEAQNNRQFVLDQLYG